MIETKKQEETRLKDICKEEFIDRYAILKIKKYFSTISSHEEILIKISDITEDYIVYKDVEASELVLKDIRSWSSEAVFKFFADLKIVDAPQDELDIPYIIVQNDLAFTQKGIVKEYCACKYEKIGDFTYRNFYIKNDLGSMYRVTKNLLDPERFGLMKNLCVFPFSSVLNEDSELYVDLCGFDPEENPKFDIEILKKLDLDKNFYIYKLIQRG